MRDPGCEPGRLLVVEDDRTLADLLLIVLRAEGYEAVHARTGAEALRQLAPGRFDGMLLDLHLPDVVGLEVLGAVRKDPAIRQLPVVVVTGQADFTVRDRKTVLLRKPPDLGEITQALCTMRELSVSAA